MPKFAELVKEIKKYAVNPSISDEDFLNAFITPYVIAGNIHNKNGDELYLDKTATSLLLNQKIDVHQKLRKAIQMYGIKEKTAKGMPDFVRDYLNSAALSEMVEILLKMIRYDPMISEQDKEIFFTYRDDPPMFLTELLFRSLSESNMSVNEGKNLWKNGSDAVEVISGDLFRYGFENRKKTRKNIVVIPVNTAFDTHVTRKFEGESQPIVSDMTIHGQWLSRMEKSGEDLDDLDKRIADSLTCLGYSAVSTGKSANGKCEIYGIGSVSVIETKNAVYFLLAISEFDELNQARSTPDNIKTAVISLLQVYDRIGQGYDLYMPVMGAGRSRTGMSFDEAYQLLVAALTDNRDKIHGHVYIVVKPENINEIEESGHDVSHENVHCGRLD